jgi:quercetin dioxygenase-like cupin family protein
VIARSFNALGCEFVRYEFATGEGLPRHNHGQDHLMIVLAGRVRVTTHDGDDLEYGPGADAVIFRAPRFHAIEALEPSSILNVFKGAAP